MSLDKEIAEQLVRAYCIALENCLSELTLLLNVPFHKIRLLELPCDDKLPRHTRVLVDNKPHVDIVIQVVQNKISVEVLKHNGN